MRKIFTTLIAIAGLPTIADAEAVKSTVTASNGVEVDVYSDDFANRYEYTGPSQKTDDGQVSVATVKKGGKTNPIELTGFFVYSGEWRRYTSALFKGGDPAKFTSTDRRVGSCSSSRYSRPSCTLIETFVIDITPAEIRAHTEGDTVSIQVRASDTSTAIFNIPVADFKAVAEVAKVDIDPPKPAATPAQAAAQPAPAKPAPHHPTQARRRR